MRTCGGILVVFVSATLANADWTAAFDPVPIHHCTGRDYVSFTTREASYIRYKARDEAANAAVRQLALALARHCQIPEERVLETHLYHNQPTLHVVWRPWHTPFDKTRPTHRARSAWRLQVGLRGVVIQAKSDEGLLSAVKTLLRLVEVSPGPCLQRMVIEDYRDVVAEHELRTALRTVVAREKTQHVEIAEAKDVKEPATEAK